MKKCLLVVFCLGMVVGLSLSALAGGIEVTGGYLLGNYDFSGLMEAKANGFVVSGEMPITGPIGAKVNFASISGKDFKVGAIQVPDGVFDMEVSRIDLLATYALPLSLPGGASLRALCGYSMTTTNSTQPDEFGDPYTIEAKTNGFLVGAEGKFAVMDKLTVSGEFGMGFGMKMKAAGFADSDMGLTIWRVSAAYQIMDNISAEVGYLSNKFTEDASNLDQTTSGFYVGARASF
ncbi:MAG: outer membrane beta-barrel protein [Chitinophagales bacterium]